MKLDLEMEEVKSIENLIVSRINELRDKIVDDADREDELKNIIRYYKKLIKKIHNQIDLKM